MAKTKEATVELAAGLSVVDEREVNRIKESEFKDHQIKVLLALAELGGKAFREEDILFQGTKIILPEGMTLHRAVDFIQAKIAEEETITEFSHTFKYRPYDGAYSAWNAFRKAFGMVRHRGQQHQGFFGIFEEPPEMVTMEVAPGKQEQVPWGDLIVPVLPGARLTLGTKMHREYGPLFHIDVEAPKKYRWEIEGLFNLIQKELETNSMYKGQAVNGATIPEFLDLSGVDRNTVVYSTETQRQLEANVWSMLRYTDNYRRESIDRKRSALLHGPYGTGKTLAAYLTAQIATTNGWTFLYARPAKDDLDQVMQTAKLYQPACVFFEDMDTVASADTSKDGITRMLDTFDGMAAKGTEIVVVLTTNHPERIHKGMVRPGRLDAVIQIAALDDAAVGRLIKVSVPETVLNEDIDWDVVGKAMADREFLPAYVKEAAQRAFRYAMSREKGVVANIRLTTQDFVDAAEGLQPQLDLMNGAKDAVAVETLTAAVRTELHQALDKHDEENIAAIMRKIDEAQEEIKGYVG